MKDNLFYFKIIYFSLPSQTGSHSEVHPVRLFQPPPFLPFFFCFVLSRFRVSERKASHRSAQWWTHWSHMNASSGPVCVPYALSGEVRVHASLACINSPCQEVAFDPNTQNLAPNMADTKCNHVGEGWAPAASGCVFWALNIAKSRLLVASIASKWCWTTSNKDWWSMGVFIFP